MFAYCFSCARLLISNIATQNVLWYYFNGLYDFVMLFAPGLSLFYFASAALYLYACG